MAMAKRVAVVGAGLAGTTAAVALHRAGVEVEVFDKGRAPGGRLASRHPPGGLTFDHGAQYFTARTEPFRAEVEAWRKRGWVELWSPSLGVYSEEGLVAKPPAEEHTERFLGVPSMRHVVLNALDAAPGLTVHTSTEIVPLEPPSPRFVLRTIHGVEHGPFDGVVMTAPAPQTALLLESVAPALAEAARSTTFLPTWAAMIAFEKEVPTPFDGIFVNDGPLSWLARESNKPGRNGSERWVLHGSSAWSAVHLEYASETVANQLAEAMSEVIGDPLPASTVVMAHRWRYARPATSAAPDIILADELHPLACAGDWTGGGGRVEMAWTAGRAAAETLIERLG